MKGKLIIIESGSDASGKATQADKLYDRLKKQNLNIKKVEFPNYKSEASSLVKMYLRGDFGKNANDVDPFIASTFFTADRYASYKTEWESFYNDGGIVISDRYTTSNMIHQASKMKKKGRDAYLDWLKDYEFNLFKIPRPDCVIFLDVPVDFSIELMRNRKNKITGKFKKDIHEKDENYLRECYSNSLDIAKKEGWKMVNCIEKGHLRSIIDINQEIYDFISNEIIKINR